MKKSFLKHILVEVFSIYKTRFKSNNLCRTFNVDIRILYGL